MNKFIWIDRQGTPVDIRTMSPDYFHNLVNYFFIELQTYNLPLFNYHLPVIIQELSRRQLSVTEIVGEGAKAYRDALGVIRLWDEETNTEMALN
jgi:hypothetical protein